MTTAEHRTPIRYDISGRGILSSEVTSPHGIPIPRSKNIRMMFSKEEEDAAAHYRRLFSILCGRGFIKDQ